MVRQDRRVEHVGVRDDDLPGGAHGRADGCRRVAVVGGRDDREVRRCRELPELGHLVLTERLRREQEQRPRRRILRDRLEGRKRVAERLPRRRGRHDDNILASVDRLDRLGLVRVQPLDAAVREPLHDPRVEPRGHVRVRRLARWDDLVVDDAARQRRLLQDATEDRRSVGGGVGSHRRVSPILEHLFGMKAV